MNIGILVFAFLFLGSILATIAAAKLQEAELSAIGGIIAGVSFMGAVGLKWGLL